MNVLLINIINIIITMIILLILKQLPHLLQDLVQPAQDNGLHLFQGQRPGGELRVPLPLLQAYYPAVQLRGPHQNHDAQPEAQNRSCDANHRARQISPIPPARLFGRLLLPPLLSRFTGDSPLLVLIHVQTTRTFVIHAEIPLFIR